MPQYVNVRRILLGHKRAAKSPLLEKFLCKCVSTDPANFVGTQELFLEYKNAVEMWTDGDNQAKILLKEKAFQRQFKKAVLAHERTAQATVRGGKRGFAGIKVNRPRREAPFNIEGARTAQKVRNFMANPAMDPPIELHEVPTDPRNAGLCAFAKKDIERAEVVTEYEGEVITTEEASRREQQYSLQGRVCAMMFFKSRGEQVAIDPYGQEQDEMTWGATINHSRHNTNLRPVVVDRNTPRPRVFFVATHDIPQMTELLWDYNDPQWEFNDNSQTIP